MRVDIFLALHATHRAPKHVDNATEKKNSSYLLLMLGDDVAEAAREANADTLGSWMPGLLPRCCGWCGGGRCAPDCDDADDGREMVRPIDGSDGRSSREEAVLKGGRSRGDGGRLW